MGNPIPVERESGTLREARRGLFAIGWRFGMRDWILKRGKI
jgi:hypothetical protein